MGNRIDDSENVLNPEDPGYESAFRTAAFRFTGYGIPMPYAVENEAKGGGDDGGYNDEDEGEI